MPLKNLTFSNGTILSLCVQALVVSVRQTLTASVGMKLMKIGLILYLKLLIQMELAGFPHQYKFLGGEFGSLAEKKACFW